MKPLKVMLSSVAVISLFVGAIWQSPANAATKPIVSSLGRFLDYSVMSHPTAIDVDAAGNLYVSDIVKGQIVKFDKYMKVVKVFKGMAQSGTSLAVTADGKKVFVGGARLVSVLDGDSGEVVGMLGAGAGEFKFAGEIDIDPVSERIYAADVASYGVKVYDLNTNEFLFRFGSRGRGAGQFRNLSSLSFNEHTGELYVSDNYSYSRYRPNVQVFNRDGQLLRSLTGYSSFGAPIIPFFSGMTFDSQGRGYVLDTINGSLRFLGLPTQKLGAYTNAGYNHGQLAMPKDVIYDEATDRLFVSCDGGRIEIFGVDGAINPENPNLAPGQPVPVSPVGDVEVTTLSPQLTYLNAEDVDGDELTYDVQVFSVDAIVADYVGLPSGEVESYAVVAGGMVENARFSWAVRAFDGEEASAWTEQQFFYVNAIEEAPLAPVTLTPAMGTVVTGETLLSWGESSDPDPFDSVSYRIEIADDAEFTQIIAGGDFSGNNVVLGTLTDYLVLQDGEQYFWRALAIDNHGLVSEPGVASSFVYDTTVLRFTANMPDAEVFIGGNYAYSGRFVGTAPLELRDVEPGTESVVIKRAGFEPYVGQVVIGERENIDYYAELVAAIMPAGLKARSLLADGEKLILNGAAAPFVTDLNSDGIVDLVVGSADGSISKFDGSLVDGEIQFSAAGLFAAELPPVAGARPFLVDWNNDRVNDLLVGGSDGSVSLFTGGVAGYSATIFNAAGGTPVAVSGDATPIVFDVDGDGDKDLLVGSSDGSIAQFLYDETTSQLVAAGTLVFTYAPASGSVAPFVSDWNADGTEDLLIAASEHLYLYSVSHAVWSPVGVLSVGDELLNNNNGNGGGAYSLGTQLTLFALELDGKNGKDVLVGNADGEIRFVRSFGKEYVSSFNAALIDKVAQIRGLDETADTADILAAIAASDYNAVTKAARTLLKNVNNGAVDCVNQLLAVLK